MIIVLLFVLGLCLGSFVNALVWRLHEQAKPKKSRAANGKDLSIATGRSMCPHCKYTLKVGDLIPVLSWLYLRGKCRNCKKPIGVQYPLVELLTAGLFILSYIFWPYGFDVAGIVRFGAWLMTLTGFMALVVYDLRWTLLPNRIVFPLGWLWVATTILLAIIESSPQYILNALLGALVGGGIFYILFQVSNEQWIGGGDVKLGFVLGLVVASPLKALLVIFLASYIGTLVALAGFIGKKHALSRHIPFGPSLMAATCIILFFGDNLISWYMDLFIL